VQRTIFILGFLAVLGGIGSRSAVAQSQTDSALRSDSVARDDAQTVDGIAARIESDILTESEVRELAAFQKLVDGQSKSRADILQELADQWIVRGEASATKYPPPSPQDVDRAYALLAKQFPSSAEFKARFETDGLSEVAVRRMLEQQLYLSRFLDYRFRSAAQIGEEQIEAYYKTEFTPQLETKGQAVPPLSDVEDTVREVLIQREISDRANKWLDDTRQRIKIDILPQEGAK
jgi:hypothetical protein